MSTLSGVNEILKPINCTLNSTTKEKQDDFIKNAELLRRLKEHELEMLKYINDHDQKNNKNG